MTAEQRIAADKAAYQQTVQNYLRATTPEQRAARGHVMQTALRATLENRYRP